MDSPGKNTGVGCYARLQGIFPTQGSNPHLLYCRQILYPPSHFGSPGPKISTSQSPDLGVTLHGKRDFADVIKLGFLRWRDYAVLSNGLQLLSQGSLWKGGKSKEEVGSRDWSDMRKWPPAKEFRQPPEAREDKESNSPLEPLVETSPAYTLTLAQRDWIWTSGLPSCKKINGYCLKPSLWWSVSAARGNEYAWEADLGIKICM